MIGVVRIQPPGVGTGGLGRPWTPVAPLQEVKSGVPGATVVEACANTVVSAIHFSLDQCQLLVDNTSSGITHLLRSCCTVAIFLSYIAAQSAALVPVDTMPFSVSVLRCSNFRPKHWIVSVSVEPV